MRGSGPLAAAAGAVALCLTCAPVAWAAPTQPCVPQQPGAPNHTEPWGQHRLDFQRVWSLTRGQGVLVGEVDSGVDRSHPQLAGRVLPVIDLTHTRPTDCDGHGTRVAGIIVGRDGTDLARQGIVFTGVAPDATLLPVKQTVGANNDVNGVALLAQGIRVATDHGAKVINVSVTTSADAPVLHDAVRYAQAHDVVIVAAAGNEQNVGQQSGPQYPANYDGVLSVSAINEKGEPASFTISATRVSVAAPGVHIISTAAGPRHQYNVDDGTSFAAPFVTGVVALVRAYHPELSYLQVEHRIEVTADRGTNPELGFGVVNPYQAVTAVLPEENVHVAAPATPHPIAPLRAAGAGDTHTRNLALLLGGIAVLASGVIVCAAVLVPRGRRRGWRPGRRPPVEPADQGGDLVSAAGG